MKSFASKKAGATRPKKKTTKKKSSNTKKVQSKQKEVVALEQEIINNPPTVSIKEDTEYLDEYMAMFRKLRKMRRMAEQKYMLSRSSRDVYALIAIYSQQREVISDIRSSTDLSRHAHLIADTILEPMLNSLAQELLNSFYSIKQVLVSNLDEDADDAIKLLEGITKNHASFIQKEYEKAKQKTLDIFNEPL